MFKEHSHRPKAPEPVVDRAGLASAPSRPVEPVVPEPREQRRASGSPPPSEASNSIPRELADWTVEGDLPQLSRENLIAIEQELFATANWVHDLGEEKTTPELKDDTSGTPHRTKNRTPRDNDL